MLLSLNDTSVHVIGKILVDKCRLTIDRVVEWVMGPLESLVKVYPGDVRYESDLDNSAKLCHHTKVSVRI